MIERGRDEGRREPSNSSPHDASSRALRVLLVEDVDSDAELTLHQLQRSGLACVSQRVETEQPLREALRVFKPDVILSDFRLPQFDGYAALRIAQELARDTPFIFVSGTIGEERAIEALHLGAADYVLKDNLKRLAPAVTGALDRAAATIERRRQQEQLATMTRTLKMLSGINSLIVRTRDQTELLEEACRLAATVGAYGAAVVMVRQPGAQALQPIAWAGRDQCMTEQLKDVLARASNHVSGPIARVLKSGAPYVCNADIDPLATANINALMAQVGFQSVVALPLLVDKTVVGVMVLIAAEAWSIGEEELQMLREISANLSFALQYLHKDSTVHLLSYFDPLTGLARRDLFCERLGNRLRKTATGARLAVGVFDIEQLSVINHSFGRHVGDVLLQHLADRLRSHFEDTERLVQLGGATFGVMLDGAADEDFCAGLADHLHAVLAESFEIEGRRIPVVVRSGVAVFPQDGEVASVLLEHAELALRDARASGVRHQLYNADQHTAVVARLALEHKLRAALAHHQFELHYQPKMTIATGRIEGVEALIRWRDPDAGLVAPAAFLPVLESTGFIVEVGEWAISQALRDHEAWQRRGLPQVRIAVNVSPLQFRRADFSDRFLSLTQSRGQSQVLDIEITESMLLENASGEISRLNRLREAGVRIAIDDFGTGYSSFGRLSELPVDTLKIDRSFIARLPHDGSGRTLVATMIGLARAFEMDCVAEGVETQEQLRALTDMGCDQSQGYLISKPLPPDALAELLERGQGRVLHT